MYTGDRSPGFEHRLYSRTRSDAGRQDRPFLLNRGCRGGEGHRKHPARPQHRADERAGDHLRPARHPNQGGLAGGGCEMEFLWFTPGLVGGHCIGVDPYSLTARAEAAGYYPQVILSGRRINDGMGAFIAQRLVELLIVAEWPVKCAKIGIVGITFKEDVPDLRNSRVPDIVAELRDFGIAASIADPLADPAEAKREYGIE